MNYETRTIAMIINPKNAELYSENFTKVEITDDGAGEFIEIAQADGRIRIDPEEWPEIMDAINTLAALCRP